MRDLRYEPLDRPPGLRERLRAVGGDARLVMGGTVAVLMVLVPVVVLTALLATGNATDAGGIAVLLMVLAGGVYVVADVLGQAGSGSALAGFARANELVLLRASMATDYAAPPFARGTYAVQQGVRTRDPLFVEVGDRTAVTARRAARGEVRPEVYLRVRLPGPLRGRRGLVTAELDAALTRFAGPHVLDVTGDELTLLGSEPLGPTPGRARGRGVRARRRPGGGRGRAPGRRRPGAGEAPRRAGPAASAQPAGGRRVDPRAARGRPAGRRRADVDPGRPPAR